MTPVNSFSYFFRKYPLFRTFIWLFLIVIAIAVTTIINIRFTHEPVLDSVNPSIGSPGDVIVLKGDHFKSNRNENYVEIGGERLTASSYLSWSNSEIKIVLPSNIQEGLVIVNISGRKSKPGVFTNEATIPVTVISNPSSRTPEISSIYPSTGATGQILTISGTNFGDAREKSQVLFKTSKEITSPSGMDLPQTRAADILPADIDEYNYEAWSDTEIKVRIPDGAVTGSIVIETENGTSHPQDLTILNRGTKTFSNGKTYLLQISANISHITATINSSLTLHVPRPIILSSQPAVEMSECSTQPLLENYRNTVIHQIQFKELDEGEKQFMHNFMVQVFEISCSVAREKIKPYSNKNAMVYIENTKATPYIHSDSEEIKTLAANIIKREKNPYTQAELIYDYLRENFVLLQSIRAGDFDLQNVLETRQADAYDFALLYTCLLRSVGIPAKVLSGILVDSNMKTQNHWWNEFYIENFGWFPVDIALASDLEYDSFQIIQNKGKYYFGNLDSQHIAFSTNFEIFKPSMVNNKIVYRPRSYALQNIWEEASVQTDSYSSFWNTPVVSGIY